MNQKPELWLGSRTGPMGDHYMRNPQGSLRFRGPSLFSYQTEIARFVGPFYLFVSEESYSPTTARQKNLIGWRFLTNWSGKSTLVRVHIPGRGFDMPLFSGETRATTTYSATRELRPWEAKAHIPSKDVTRIIAEAKKGFLNLLARGCRSNSPISQGNHARVAHQYLETRMNTWRDRPLGFFLPGFWERTRLWRMGLEDNDAFPDRGNPPEDAASVLYRAIVPPKAGKTPLVTPQQAAKVLLRLKEDELVSMMSLKLLVAPGKGNPPRFSKDLGVLVNHYPRLCRVALETSHAFLH